MFTPKEQLSVVKVDGQRSTISSPFATIASFVPGGEAAAQWFGLDAAILLYENEAKRWLWWSPSHNRWVVLDEHFSITPKGTRKWLAGQNGNSEEWLLTLAEQETDPDVLQEIAEHSNASAAVIERVAATVCAIKDAGLIMPLARLDKFSKNAAWLLFHCFKDNPHHAGLLTISPLLPSEMLEEMASLGAKSAAASHRNASPEMLVRLSTDPDVGVRYNVASNKNTPAETLLMLAQSVPYEKKPEGGQASQCALLCWRILENLTKNISAPSEALVIAAKDEDTWRDIAAHPNAPPNILRKIAGSESYYARINVAKNKNTPRDVLAELALDSDKDVQKAARNNKNYRSPSRMKRLKKP